MLYLNSNKDVVTLDDKVNLLMSTSAIPGIFPFVEWRNTTFVDGGVANFMDVEGGIKYCEDKGF